MLQKIIVAFSSTANTFKNKSKLTEFYKAIHPDMLQNAPDNVKMENTRSLKILNNYFDAVSQNERTEPQELVFYMAEKQNTKARKFLPFTIVLDAYLGKDQQGAIDKVTTQIREQINQKYQEIRKDFTEKHANPFVTYTNQYEKAKKNFFETTTTLKKRSSTQESEQLAMRASIFSAQMQSEYDNFLKSATQQMRQANMPQIKPRLWASIMIDKCDMIPNLFQIFDQLIDPRLIFFDQDLTKEESDIFVEKIIPKTTNLMSVQALSPLFSRLEKADPQICLYVTKRYGATDIPGYFSIPYNFDVQEIQQQFGIYQKQIKQEREEYEQELKKYQQSLYNLADRYSITNIQNEVLLKNTEVVRKLNLSLLILQKQLNEVNTQRLNNLRMKQWVLTESVSKTVDSNDHFYIPIPFSGTV
ncbi:unnamed protein product (macronuclear) [Paramecium tetraurelia]|uniref:DUF4460 domain-containing protein n=1 Tax=Paramecium tetraurelia TaxID=5888 RepID=A0CUK2_PARTE|nr:uncharacterized protein GSPATT00010669001 [Paramecium tetraurelia]CAK74469.1 unnamed protein product [Paramecium tetraurelia]|eukprot:XP_001441866.1 hypothetical protein (macronuclear) [Paramecium tetraurelia strain d4-2]